MPRLGDRMSAYGREREARSGNRNHWMRTTAQGDGNAKGYPTFAILAEHANRLNSTDASPRRNQTPCPQQAPLRRRRGSLTARPGGTAPAVYPSDSKSSRAGCPGIGGQATRSAQARRAPGHQHTGRDRPLATRGRPGGCIVAAPGCPDRPGHRQRRRGRAGSDGN